MNFKEYDNLDKRRDVLWDRKKKGVLTVQEKVELEKVSARMGELESEWQKLKYDEKTGRRMWYEYHCYEGVDSSDVHLWYRSHQQIDVIDISEPGGMYETLVERGEQGMPRTYNIRFDDGLLAEAWEDEVVESPDKFYMEPPPVEYIRGKVSSEKLKLRESYVNRWEDFLNETYSRAPLYHSLKHNYALNALKNDSLACHSSQRIWPGGKRLKDDEPGYEDSWYLRGLSLTRDKYYAQGWNSVVFEFDQEKLSTRYKMLPYNWGYHIGGGYRQDMRAKREKEEFLIMKIVKEPKGADEFIDMQLEPVAYLTPLSHYLIGFTIDDFVFERILSKEQKEYFSSHPLFRGVFTRKRGR